MKVRLETIVAAEEYIDATKLPPFLKNGLHVLHRIFTEYLRTPLSVSVQSLPDFLPLPSSLTVKAEALKKQRIVSTLQVGQSYPDEPFQYICDALPHGFGHDFFSLEKATAKALGEAVERYLWSDSDEWYTGKAIRASYKELKADHAIDIFSLAGFSQEQREKNEKLQFSADTVFSWIPMHSLTRNKEVYCPTSLMSVKHREEHAAEEPMLLWNITTGQATRGTLTEAQLYALLEIIERDAFMISYLNMITPPKIDLEQASFVDEEIQYIMEQCTRHRLEAYALALPTDFPVRVVLGVLVDKTGLGPAVVVGGCASFDDYTSIKHALSEALAVRYSLKGVPGEAVALTHLGRKERLVYWARTENMRKLDFMLQGNEMTHAHFGEDSQSPAEKLQLLLKVCREKKYEVACTEMTPPRLRALGFRSVSMIMPDMQPLHLDESLPYLGGARLTEVPPLLGYKTAKTFNTTPHPFP